MKRFIRLLCLTAITIGLSGCAIFTADGGIYTRTVYDPYPVPVYRYRIYSPPPHHHKPTPPPHHGYHKPTPPHKPNPHHSGGHNNHYKPGKPAPRPSGGHSRR